MKTNIFLGFIALWLAAVAISCTPARHTAAPGRPSIGQRPGDRPGKTEPVDTLRWTSPTNAKPPIKNDTGRPNDVNGAHNGGLSSTYHLALLLPFLSSQTDQSTSVPDKSRLGLQFYAGAKVALDRLSHETGLNLVVDVYDTQLNDADIQSVLSDSHLNKAEVLIGPIRSNQVQQTAAWALQNRKILISPESPNAGLTSHNPDFIQINPSLRAHCEAITRHVLANYKGDVMTLVCKKKEADRLPYFQDYLKSRSAATFGELVVPDEIANFDNIDLKPYFSTNKKSVFILPSWASQDFVMAFFRKLKAVKGNTQVAVFGMPQWKGFESIEPEYLTALNVHISAASYLDYAAADIQKFQQAFYDANGTIPDEDGFSGYDAMLFAGTMLKQWGLSFPEHLAETNYNALHSPFRFSRIYNNPVLDEGSKRYDYLENTFVHILKFDRYGFVPVEK